ncbi:Xylulose Kinase [Chondrus crispus]|uniref:glycerol kinase n=1 Tax=Chondrus crispus TaxID=2769 RepID=R7QR00_CHOCR|nr:Xylulose Kinase [Chondrus crispus]CDF39815.1 Xylulose Kinase [Chondrus crispus]|eukprot:XP_005710109.1 Xylulose Kinase [Chondrus crispus]
MPNLTRTGLVAGVDSSTGATKLELIDLNTGVVVAQARRQHPATTPPESEQDPRAWWNALLGCFEELQHHLPDVKAVSISGQQHGFVALDGNNDPVRPAKLWNDTTSAPQSRAMIEKLGPATWASAVGSLPAPAFTVTKLAWLAANEPHSLLRVRRVGLPHDYLNLRLTGRWGTDRGDASGTGYWSAQSGEYLTDLIEAAGVSPDMIEFPEVLGPFEVVGNVVAPELLALGLSSDVVAGPGSGDNMCAALGLGLRAGDVVVSLGTSGTAYAVSDTGTNDELGLVAGFADATGHFLPLVCTLNATKVTESIRRLLGVSFERLDELALSAPQGANGLTLVPYFDGERTPNRPDATGALVGLRTSVERADMARAAFEGVTCGLLDGVDALIANGVTADGRFFLIGGGSKSKAFAAIFASLAERDILRPASDETVARGAAVQAACVLTGHEPSRFTRLWRLDESRLVSPSLVQGEAASVVRERYRTEASMR